LKKHLRIYLKIKKKILIDGLSLLSPFTGVAKYTYENAYRLEKKYADGYEWFYDYGFHSKELIQSTNSKKSVHILKKVKALIVSNPIVKKIGRETLSLLSYISSPTYDLYWQPNYIPKRIKSKKIITTVHDFSFYIQPEWHPKERLNYYKKYFWKQASSSDLLITGSHFTKQEIIKYMHYPEEKITVIYHGVDHELYKVYEQNVLEESKNKFDLNTNFLLFVGSIEPRKNLLNLLKAYHLLSNSIKHDYPLVLVGFKGWENRDIMQEIEKDKEHIKYLGYLTNEELVHVYNLATLFIYPSLYEGFGIPPLEAMACKTAVIASNVASIPEVCADAAMYIDPNNPHDIAKKITTLLMDTQKRLSLAEKGFKHSQQFTWEKAAQAHMNVFQKVLKS